MEIFKILGLVSINNKEANKSLDEVNKKAENVSKELEKKFESIGKGFSKAGETMSKIGSKITKTVTVPLMGISVAAGKTAIDFVKLKESSMGVFEKMLGGSEAAEEMYQSLLKVAKASTYSQEAFLTAGKTLVGMGTSAEDTTKYLQAITDAVAGFGGSSADIESLASVFGKVSAKGKVLTDDLNMLSERGVNGLQILAAHYGKTTDEMQEMVSEGMVPAKEGLDILCDGMENGYTYAGQFHQGLSGMAQQLKGGTLTGALDGLKSSFRNFSVELVGAFDNKQYMIDLVNAFGTALGHLPKLLSGITDSIAPALQKVSRLLNKFNEFAQTKEGQESLKKIGDLILKLAVAGPIITILGKLTSKFSGVFTAISELHGAGGITGLINKFSIVPSLLKKVNTGLKNITNPIKIVKNGFGGLKTIIGNFLPMIQGIIITFNASGGGLSGVLSVTKLALSGVASGFMGLLGTILPVVAPIVALIGLFIVLKQNWDKIINVFNDFIKRIKLEEKLDNIKKKLQPLSEKLKGLKDLFKVIGTVVGVSLVPAISILAGLFNGLLSAISPIIDLIGNVIDLLSGVGEIIVGIFTLDGDKILGGLKKVFGSIVGIITAPFKIVWSFISGFFEGIGSFFGSLLEKLGITQAFDNIKNAISEWWNGVVIWWQEKWNNVCLFFSILGTWLHEHIVQPLVNAKNKIVEVVTNIKDGIVEKFNLAKEKVGNIFEGIKNFITEPIRKAKDKVGEYINNIKNFFTRFTAKIKLPHFSIKNASLNPADWIKKGIPKIAVDWYAKAMDSGMILDEPTIFGMNKDGQLMGAGEKGSETVVGTNSLMNMIKQSVNSQNHLLEARIDTLIEILLQYLPILAERQLYLDTGELVGALTSPLDKALGDLSDKKGRGR